MQVAMKLYTHPHFHLAKNQYMTFNQCIAYRKVNQIRFHFQFRGTSMLAL